MTVKTKQAISNVKKLHWAKATVGADGTVTYDTPIRIADLVKIATKVSEDIQKKYTDSGVADVIKTFKGGTVTINTYGIDQEVLNQLEGHSVDTNGVTDFKTTDEAPFGALGYELIKRNGESKFVWLLLIQKQLNGDEDDAEVKGEKMNVKDSTLTFEIFEREDNRWKKAVSTDDTGVTDLTDDKWFKQVYNGNFAA